MVYAARDRSLDLDVAVKLLVPPPAAAHLARERMRREVQAVRGLSHAGIVAVHDFAEDAGWSFIIMELVDGVDLSVRTRTSGPLTPDEALAVGRDISAALSVAHRRGILHRDVKPQNILLESDGRARLTDFGSARLDGLPGLTQTGAMVGTLPYTAPEVIAGGRGDARADVFALGVTLYQALAGALPAGATASGPPAASATGYSVRAVRKDVPAWLDAAIARATSAAPDHRFPTAGSFLDALAPDDSAAEHRMQPRPLPVSACVVCGAPEPFGLTVCARCGGAAPGVADTIVYVRRIRPGGDRAATLQILDEMLGSRAAEAGSRLSTMADLPLLRVPAPLASRVIDRLEDHGLAARAVPAARAWTTIPAPFYALLAAVSGVGMVAGASVLPSLLWTSPLVAGILLATANHEMRRPVVVNAPRITSVPADVERTLVDALAHLPPGEARNLLARVVQLAEPLFAALAAGGDAHDIAGALRTMLAACARVALDLAQLDASFAALTGAGRLNPADAASWMEDVSRCERARDALVQRMLEAIAALGRLHGQAARLAETVGAVPALAELAAEMDLEAGAREKAVGELEEVLSTKY